MWKVNRSSGHCATRHKSCENRTEESVRIWLESGGWETLSQPCRLFPLADEGTYTPDFLAWKPGVSGVMVVEVKPMTKNGMKVPYTGHEQGYERYRRAAAQYDGDTWHFVMVSICIQTKEMRVDVWGEPVEQ